MQIKVSFFNIYIFCISMIYEIIFSVRKHSETSRKKMQLMRLKILNSITII